MSALAEFQSVFAKRLMAPALDAMPARDAVALSVYRNTVMKGWIDALAANYPTARKLVGEEWFNAAASEFVRQSPPGSSVLAGYGEAFVAFLTGFPAAREIPYLSEVAGIDRLWIESFFAVDTSIMSASLLQCLSGDELLDTRLQLHPATRLCSCKHSAVTIWLHNRSNQSGELVVDDSDEDAVITRTPEGVTVTHLCSIEFRFLDEIGNGATLGEAAMTALSIDPEFPLAATLAKLINTGCFASE